MTKTKMYTFKDHPAFTTNVKLVEAVGERPHIRQVSVVVGATSKKAALASLQAVGLGVSARETHLCLSDNIHNQKLMDDGILQDGTVLVTAMIPRVGSNIVSLIATEDYRNPEIKVAATVQR